MAAPTPEPQVIHPVKRYLANHLRTIVAAATTIFTLAAGIYSFLQKDAAGRWTLTLIVAGVFVLLWIFIRFRPVQSFVLRLIYGPPQAPPNLDLLFRGPRPFLVADAGKLPERQADISSIRIDLEKHPFYLLTGDSGSGKTSLVNAGLIPALQAAPSDGDSSGTKGGYRVIHGWSVATTPEKNLRDKLRQDFAAGDTPISKNLDLPKTLNAAVQTSSRQGQRLLLILDQLEELFVTVPETGRLDFFRVLRDARARHGDALRLLIVHRGDFQDLVHQLCRAVDPKGRQFDLGASHWLQSFTEDQAARAILTLLSPLTQAQPVTEPGCQAFATRLAADLLRPPLDPRRSREDIKIVLPVELQIIGFMLQERLRLGGTHQAESIARLNAQTLTALGGKQKLLRDYLTTSTDKACRLAKLPETDAKRILLALEPAHDTKQAHTLDHLAKEVRLPPATVEKALHAYAQSYVVEILPATAGDSKEEDSETNNSSSTTSHPARYQLMHDQLASLLTEVADPAYNKNRDARERLDFWEQRAATVQGAHPAEQAGQACPTKPTHTPSNPALSFLTTTLLKPFRQPIPIGEVFSLWKHATTATRPLLRQSAFGFSLKTLSLTFFLTFLFWVPIQDLWILQKLSNLDVTYNKGTVKFHNNSADNKTINLCLSLLGRLHLTKPTSIDLYFSTQLRDIDGLKGADLSHLETLDLGTCQNLRNIDGLSGANLCNLRSLNLSSCSRLSHLNGLSNSSLSKLRDLMLSNCNSLKDLNVLEGAELANLQNLDLSSCQAIDDLHPIISANLFSLTTLKLIDCDQLHDCSFLNGANLSKLKELDLSRSDQLNNIYGLKNANLLELKTLNLSSCPQLEDINEFDLSNLENLNLSFTKLSDISPLKNAHLPNLLILDLSGCYQLKNLDSLSDLRLPSLSKLYLSNNSQLSDLSGLKSVEFTNLRTLSFSGCESLRDLSTLFEVNLPNLDHLILSSCDQLQDINALKDIYLKGLLSLDLSNCDKLRDLSPLKNAGLPALRSLDLSFCDNLGSLDDLLHTDLPSLRSVNVRGCFQLTPSDIEALQSRYPDAEILHY